jgi:hypothetical protein
MVRKEDVTTVAVARFMNVANDIALARITVENTSAGMSQAPGPIPRLKKHKYAARPMIPIVPFNWSKIKVAASRKTEKVIPLNLNNLNESMNGNNERVCQQEKTQS